MSKKKVAFTKDELYQLLQELDPRIKYEVDLAKSSIPDLVTDEDDFKQELILEAVEVINKKELYKTDEWDLTDQNNAKSYLMTCIKHRIIDLRDDFFRKKELTRSYRVELYGPVTEKPISKVSDELEDDSSEEFELESVEPEYFGEEEVHINEFEGKRITDIIKILWERGCREYKEIKIRLQDAGIEFNRNSVEVILSERRRIEGVALQPRGKKPGLKTKVKELVNLGFDDLSEVQSILRNEGIKFDAAQVRDHFRAFWLEKSKKK